MQKRTVRFTWMLLRVLYPESLALLLRLRCPSVVRTSIFLSPSCISCMTLNKSSQQCVILLLDCKLLSIQVVCINICFTTLPTKYSSRLFGILGLGARVEIDGFLQQVLIKCYQLSTLFNEGSNIAFCTNLHKYYNKSASCNFVQKHIKVTCSLFQH